VFDHPGTPAPRPVSRLSARPRGLPHAAFLELGRMLAATMSGELDRVVDRRSLATRLRSIGTWTKRRAVGMRDALTRVSGNTWIGVALLTGGTAVAIVEDFASDVWVDRPLLAALAGGVLLLGWTVVLVNQYLADRERRRWLTVAVAALEDLGRVARATWFQLVVNLHLTTIFEPQVAVLRVQMMSAQGRASLAASVAGVAQTPKGRREIFNELYKIAEGTREVLSRWTPIMITQPPEAGHLSDFADLYRRVVQLLRFLVREVESGWPLAIPEQEVADKLVTIIEMAARQDHDLFEGAEEIAALWEAD